MPTFDKVGDFCFGEVVLLCLTEPCLLCFCAPLSKIRSVYVKMSLKYFILVQVSCLILKFWYILRIFSEK